MTYHPIVICKLGEGPYAGQSYANPQPWPQRPDTADFRDHGDRAKLASIGIFSIDRTAHRAKRDAERGSELTLDGAYQFIGLDRRREHNRLCAEHEAGRTDGVWARSTGEYTKARSVLDQDVLATARKWGYSA